MNHSGKAIAWPALALILVALLGCGCRPTTRVGASSPAAAVEQFARAVVVGDESAAAEVSVPELTAEDLPAARREYFGLEATESRRVDVVVDDVISAGEDPNDRGYMISIRPAGETSVIASATVYVGEYDGRYLVWGVSP